MEKDSETEYKRQPDENGNEQEEESNDFVIDSIDLIDLPIGMLCIVIGIFTDNLGLWLPIGLCLGVALGMRNKKK